MACVKFCSDVGFTVYCKTNFLVSARVCCFVSGMCVFQYLQNVTSRLCMGAEMLYQYGPNVPGSEIAIYTIAGRYASKSQRVTGQRDGMGVGGWWEVAGWGYDLAGGNWLKTLVLYDPDGVILPWWWDLIMRMGFDLEGVIWPWGCDLTLRVWYDLGNVWLSHPMTWYLQWLIWHW